MKTFAEIIAELPELDFTDGMTTETIMGDMIDDYNEKMTDITEVETSISTADPVRAVLYAGADIFGQFTQLIDRNAKLNMLAYSYDEFLDNIGVTRSINRNDPIAATCTVRFSLEEAQSADVEIPEGTLVTDDEDVYFATDTSATIKAAVKAGCTLQFTLSAAQSADVTIPAGTQVSNGTTVFSTDNAVTISAGATTAIITASADTAGSAANGIAIGAITTMVTAITNVSVSNTTATSGGSDADLYVDVNCTCADTGIIGNDFAVGEINDLVDDIAYITAVANTTVSSGGSDTEDDDDYRERIYNSPSGYSTAGPIGAYEYWALAYSDDVIDVYVYRPSAGNVYLYFVLSDGVLPDANTIAKMTAFLDDSTKRPMTDNLTVFAPTIVSYDVNLKYYINSSDSSRAESIAADVSDAVDDYVLWQKSKIGRSIDPTELVSYIKTAGARAEITSPAHTVLTETQLAVAGNITITYGGTE